MKIKKNKLIISIWFMLLSILFIIRGIEHQVVLLRITFSLGGIGLFIGSLGLLYEEGKKI
jgi:hypothetical protein